MISVTVTQLTKRFGSVVALKNLDLEIRPGELFFLLGPSGCGKTTLLRSIAGFYIPEEGIIRFDQDDVTRLPPHKRNTGMMFQSYALWPHMSVAQNVGFGLAERKVPKEEINQRVKEALASVRMEAYGERRPNQLSGGQQQRVALARALVIRPRCLLLDEPLSNLDARLRLEMRGEIRRVCKEFNLTTIYVTHDQKEALSIADRMAVLEDGHILQVGSPEEIYKRPHTQVVANFIGETNFLPGTFEGLEGDRALVSTELGRFQGVLPSGNGRTPDRGSAVVLSIRPECFSLSKAKPEVNSFAGRIGRATYLGEVAQYAFRAKEQEMKVLELNPRFLHLSDGEEVFAQAAPEDVVVLTS
ncbi:MAG: ABC transporter ATP-binding protein [Puniceicoccaceae bacterium]|nr:MAG: ABC transporter ATP-binding protein [Puniceicoccaceae bacterium]